MSTYFKSILIPTDFSPAAWKAMRVGLDLGNLYKATITVLHIFPSMNGSEEEQTSFDYLEKMKANMEKLNKELTEEHGQKVVNLVVSGNVNDTLLDFVGNNQFDLVIMGVNSSGQNNSPGTHAISIIEKSKIPVLVVPNNYPVNE